MSDWPEHRDELSRKMLDHFLDRASANAEGEISDYELWDIADTIITITQGLSNRADWEMIYAAREELGKALGKKVSKRK